MKRRRLLATIFVMLIASWPLWIFVLRPTGTFLSYLGATTGGEGHYYLSRLAQDGPLGAYLTRRCALSSLADWAALGHYNILYNRELWIGRTRSQIRADFGPPEESTPDRDIWLIGKKDVLKQKRRDPSLAWDETTARQWALTLAAEYENDRLVRFGNPDSATQYLEPIQNSPYQLRHQPPVDIDHLTAHPPKEWPTSP